MSDQPVTLVVLAKFHREVLLPDVQRIVGDAVSASETRLRDEVHTLHDSLLVRLERLEDEYQSIKAGLPRVEERLDRGEGRLDRLELVYQDLIAAFHRLEERLSRLEKTLDELAAAQARDTLRAEVAELRTRVDALQEQIRAVEKRLDG